MACGGGYRGIRRAEGRMKHLQLILSVVLCVFGCGLLVAGFILPPAGTIDSSVLVAFGEILTFVGSLTGIDYKYKQRTPDP